MKISSKIIFNLLVILLFWLLSVSTYAQNSSRETIYLHTDRSVYVSGETIYYKLYLLDAISQKRSPISKIGYIAIRAANQSPVIKCRVKIDSGVSTGSILLPDTLSSGVYQVIAFTNSMMNYGEKRFFHNEIVIVNSFDKNMNFRLFDIKNETPTDIIKPLNITTNKKIYATREKVFVHIDKTNIKANLSVSVFKNSKIQSSNNTISNVLNTPYNKEINSSTTEKYLLERKTKIIRGTVVDSTTEQNIQNATVLLSCVDSVPNLQYAITNSNGTFQMPLSNYYDGKEMFFTIREMPANQHWKIKIDDEFAQFETWNPTLKYDIGSYRDFLIKSQNIAYINVSYQADKDTINRSENNEKVICPRFYYCPTQTVLLSDYASLNDFKEIIVELFPQIRISKEKGKYKISVLNGSQKMFSNSEIAIFLDGVYVDDVDKIMKLGSEQIKKIEVLNTERVFGSLVYRGSISISTKSNEIEKTTPCSYSLRMKNDKINRHDNYVVEKPETISNKKQPFFKQLLYWNPDLEINLQENTNFEFFTSDNEGNFTLKIEGITDDGQPISYSSNIQVINQPKSTEK